MLEVIMQQLFHYCSNRVEVAYLEAIALKRQEELIREEEAAEQAEIKLKARREAAEKEKRNKKKQVFASTYIDMHQANGKVVSYN